MIHAHLRRIAGVMAAVMLITCPVYAAEKAQLVNLTVTNNRDTLLFYMDLENAFNPEIMAALESGVTLSFSFPITVRRDRSLWFDKKITQVELIHTIKYDTLKKEYLITRSWKDPQTQTVKSLDEAISLMTRIDGLALLPLSLLEKGENYRVTAQARLNKISRPIYLKFVLFFRNSWKFKTKKAHVDFIY